MLAFAAIMCLLIGSALGSESVGVCSIVAPVTTVCAGSRVKIHWSALAPVRTPTYLSTSHSDTRYPLQLGSNYGVHLLPVGSFTHQQVTIVNDAGDVLCDASVKITPCEVCHKNSDSVLDACGACGGDSACIGCDGSAYSLKFFDRCGICGGSGTCANQVTNGGLTTDRHSQASSAPSRTLQVPSPLFPPMHFHISHVFSQQNEADFQWDEEVPSQGKHDAKASSVAISKDSFKPVDADKSEADFADEFDGEVDSAAQSAPAKAPAPTRGETESGPGTPAEVENAQAAEVEKKAKAEADAKAMAEDFLQKAKAEAEKKQAEADAKAKAEAEKKAKAEADAKAKAEAEK